jgi:hypothetical protein
MIRTAIELTQSFGFLLNQAKHPRFVGDIFRQALVIGHKTIEF